MRSGSRTSAAAGAGAAVRASVAVAAAMAAAAADGILPHARARRKQSHCSIALDTTPATSAHSLAVPPRTKSAQSRTADERTAHALSPLSSSSSAAHLRLSPPRRSPPMPSHAPSSSAAPATASCNASQPAPSSLARAFPFVRSFVTPRDGGVTPILQLKPVHPGPARVG